MLDLPHKIWEQCTDGSVIIRNGSVRLRAGELSVLPSHMSGDVVLIRAKNSMSEVLNSMSHGTGRALPRGECKPFAENYDYRSLRTSILIPDCIGDSSLRTDGPFAYRDLDDCLTLIQNFVEVEEGFAVAGYMGHLG